jgi:hypothetical protein
MRAKTYNTQMKHDLSIKTLQFVTPKNNSDTSNLYFLADIYDSMGDTIGLKSP